MCEPTTIVTGLGLIGNTVGAIVDHSAQQDAYNKNQQAALEAENLGNRQITLRQMQEQQAARQSIFLADLEARRADAQARVMAGESGVAGASVDAVLGDIEQQRLMNQQTIEKNRQMAADQMNEQRKALRAQAQNQINSVNQPNPFATGLRIGTAGLEAANTYFKNQPRIGGK